MNRNLFHLMPYIWKKKHPMDHSCAVCKHRPIDFCNVPNNKRSNPDKPFTYKNGVTENEIFEALKQDAKEGHTSKKHEELRIYRKCDMSWWSNTVPFYENDFTCFVESEQDILEQ